jgi:Short-chain dehydrogenases of various substrate specificities
MMTVMHKTLFLHRKKVNMQDKVIIITGASSGIGLACALEFASRGARLALAARSLDKLESIQKELQSKGSDVIVVKTDVSIDEDCKHLIEQTISAFGRIDVLVNNAGLSMRAAFADTDIKVLKTLMDVNFWGTVYCTKYALPWLLKSKGSVVGISSIAGFMGLPGRTGYSASKFAMHGFLETLRTENLKTGLHVLIAAPGFTASNVRKVALTASGQQQGETPRAEDKMMSAEAVAKHLAKAIIKRKRTLILTFVEGKLTVFLNKWCPSLVSKLAYNHMAKEPDSPFK